MYQATQNEEDKAVSLALGIIHHKILEGEFKENISKQLRNGLSYMEALLSSQENHPSPPSKINKSLGERRKRKENNTVFITGFQTQQ